MGLIKNSIAIMKGKHLTREDRIRIEILLNRQTSISEIAQLLGRHMRTIEREINRGTVEHLDSELRNILSYSCETGQRIHDFQRRVTCECCPGKRFWFVPAPSC